MSGSNYHNVYESWQNAPEAFWETAAQEIDWFKPADKIFDPDQGVYGRWFAGATCNTCYNAVDRHVEKYGRGDQPAIIHDSAVTGSKTIWTYSDLRDEVRASLDRPVLLDAAPLDLVT